jgi:NADPH:quinone reductase-like Zn-dependent oxidoreductase
VNFLMRPDAKGLAALARLVEEGKVQPRLAEVLPFARAREAQEQNQKGLAHGKVVLDLRSAS